MVDQPTSFAEKLFYSNYRVVKSEPFNIKVMKGEKTNKQTNPRSCYSQQPIWRFWNFRSGTFCNAERKLGLGVSAAVAGMGRSRPVCWPTQLWLGTTVYLRGLKPRSNGWPSLRKKERRVTQTPCHITWLPLSSLRPLLLCFSKTKYKNKMKRRDLWLVPIQV